MFVLWSLLLLGGTTKACNLSKKNGTQQATGTQERERGFSECCEMFLSFINQPGQQAMTF
jgi:hypothetical protein